MSSNLLCSSGESDAKLISGYRRDRSAIGRLMGRCEASRKAVSSKGQLASPQHVRTTILLVHRFHDLGVRTYFGVEELYVLTSREVLSLHGYVGPEPSEKRGPERTADERWDVQEIEQVHDVPTSPAALSSADDGTHNVAITASDGLGATTRLRLFGGGEVQ